MKKLLTLSMMCMSMTLVSQSARAVDQKAPENKGAQMMQEHMAEAMKMGQPSDAHKTLEPLIGNWTYTVKMWMDAKGKPQTMTGKSENTMIMGGRFLQQMAHGDPMPGNQMPGFEGRGVTGYDNIKKEYVSTWIDNMSTGIMTGKGAFDSAGKVFTESGTFSCPIQMKDVAYSAKWTIKDKNSYKYETFMADPVTGKDFRSMEITYKRIDTK